jgi:hypothetical protein
MTLALELARPVALGIRLRSGEPGRAVVVELARIIRVGVEAPPLGARSIPLSEGPFLV